MIDFHVHLLPGIDDGAKNIRMSISILEEELRQGVDIVIATPHCYFDRPVNTIIKRRNRAYKRLISACKKNNVKYPQIILGFEVHLSPNIMEQENLEELTISRTNIMLVEMPRTKWTDEDFKRIEFLIEKGFNLIFAHPERYKWVASEKDYERLFSYGFYGQINAASLISPATNKVAYKLIKEGRIKVMGSDAHNTGKRAVFMEIASELLNKNIGGDTALLFQKNAKEYLGI